MQNKFDFRRRVGVGDQFAEVVGDFFTGEFFVVRRVVSGRVFLLGRILSRCNVDLRKQRRQRFIAADRFIEGFARRGANTLNGATGDGVANDMRDTAVERRRRAHQGLNRIHKQNDFVARVCSFSEQVRDFRLQFIRSFEVTKQRIEIQFQDAASQQLLRHVAMSDSAGDPGDHDISDCLRVGENHRVVFAASRQNLDRAIDLYLVFGKRIVLALRCRAGDVAGVAFQQCLGRFLRLAIATLRASAIANNNAQQQRRCDRQRDHRAPNPSAYVGLCFHV